MRELKRLPATPTRDEDELRDLVREMSKLKEQSPMACTDPVILVRKVLEPEQLAQLLEACYRVEMGGQRQSECGVSSCSTE